MPLRVCGQRPAEFSLAIQGQGLCHGGRLGGVDRHPGSLQDAEGLGAAMTGDQRLGAEPHHGFRRLDAGAVGRVQVLIVDQLATGRVRIVDKEPGGATESRIKRRVEVAAGGGENDVQGFSCK